MIQVTAANADSVLKMFGDFASESLTKRHGEKAAAYLFPGHSEFTVAQLRQQENPVFAVRQGFFRSANDKAVNNYVRQIFLEAVAQKLGCKVSTLPRLFSWAGQLDALKVSDFGKGRPLTARRIDAITKAVGQIQAKFSNEVARAKENNQSLYGTDQIGKHFASVVTLTRHEIPKEIREKLPKFAEATIRRDHDYAADIEDDGRDLNVSWAKEQGGNFIDARMQAVASAVLREEAKLDAEEALFLV